MILDLIEEGSDFLTKPVPTFDFSNTDVDTVKLVNDLIETMTHHRGIGLSANQCGLPHRVFVMWSEKPLACFNPRIIDVSAEQVLLEEGCLSYPHLYVKIKRPKHIKVRFQNVYGETLTEKFTGMTARCFLHELDHLNGIVYHSRANKIHFDRAVNQRKQLLRSLKRGEAFIKPTEVPPLNMTGLGNV